MTYQGRFGYPYCPVCDRKLKIGSLWGGSKTVPCTYCGTRVTVTAGFFKNKIRHWEPPEELQSELQQGEGTFCSKCGRKLAKDSNYCDKCGAKLSR